MSADRVIARGLERLDGDSDFACVLWPIPDGERFRDIDYSKIGTYLQCAGNAKRMTIEMRDDKGGAVHHYVVGRTGDRRALEKAQLVDSKAGGVLVFPNEVFDVRQAIPIFQYYYTHDTVPENCELRPL